ncbi:Uncharacterised protein [Mycobacteroides abscessus subsp. abscessus]|nr:Uncharacterised protein [Mycobacteroides abscessus subsp. abscessus]SIH56904.1 Uncharacterised protein [Mycobacteroides abscessus subsp. abscessus]
MTGIAFVDVTLAWKRIEDRWHKGRWLWVAHHRDDTGGTYTLLPRTAAADTSPRRTRNAPRASTIHLQLRQVMAQAKLEVTALVAGLAVAVGPRRVEGLAPDGDGRGYRAAIQPSPNPVAAPLYRGIASFSDNKTTDDVNRMQVGYLGVRPRSSS